MKTSFVRSVYGGDKCDPCLLCLSMSSYLSETDLDNFDESMGSFQTSVQQLQRRVSGPL